MWRSYIDLSLRAVVESVYFIVGLIILLFAIVTFCLGIDVETKRLVNVFALLSRMLKGSCWLPSRYEECPRYMIDSFGYKYLT